MESVLQLFSEWEIQLLVLLSFMLQIFLFFSGGLRQRSTNMLLRGTIWISYLGADLVAVYALGFLSRHEEEDTTGRGTLTKIHPLAFFWAPFLLVHLGGQDTITAFAIEDNSLWLRHLLNLIVQVALALYVFWKSIGWHNVQLLVPGIFVFVAGIIKYGERTLALKYGNISGSSDETIKKNFNPEVRYSSIVSFALDSAPGIRHLFSGRMLHQIHGFQYTDAPEARFNEDQLTKVVDVELGIMYYDLYTKARVLRTRSGIILRCISQVSAMAALVLFAVTNKQRYNRADIAITYTLFIGAFFLDVCATFMMVIASPWTWAWLKAHECHRLTSLSWILLSTSIIGWPEEKPLWSNRMGQYSFLSYLGCNMPSSPSERVMSIIRKTVKAVGAGESMLFWMSKLLDTKYEEVDKQMMQCITKGIDQHGIIPGSSSGHQQPWPHLGPFLQNELSLGAMDFSHLILVLHMFTEVHLSDVSASTSISMDAETAVLVRQCRKLSNYMLYLLVAHTSSSMLQVTAGCPEAHLQDMRNALMEFGGGGSGGKEATLPILRRVLLFQREVWSSLPEPCKGTLEETRDLWVRLVIYAAGKSRPEKHAAELARGGELLTFVWLLMAHNELGDSTLGRVELTNAPGASHFHIDPSYAFKFPQD